MFLVFSRLRIPPPEKIASMIRTRFLIKLRGGRNLAGGSLRPGVRDMTDGSGKWIMQGGTVELYAKWGSNKTAVHLNLNGTTYGSKTIAVDSGSRSVPADYVAPMKYGFEFLGYFTGTEGGSLVIDSAGSFESDVTGITGASGEWIYRSQVLTLHAHWKPVAVPDPSQAPDGMIKYDANGGSFEGKVEIEETAPFIKFDKVPTRDGYKFLGWSETPDAKAPEYVPSMEQVPAYRDLVLYSVWEPINDPTFVQVDYHMYWFIIMMIIVLITSAYITYRRWREANPE